MIPDSSLLIKAVERLGQPQVTDPPAIFRVQAFKLQHGVDHRPTHDIAVSLAQLFLAELETLSLQPAESKKPRVSALKEDGELRVRIARRLKRQVGQPLSLRSRRPKVVLLLPVQPAPAAEVPSLGLSATQALKDAATSLRQELLKAIKVVGSNPPEDLGTRGKGLIDGELLVASEPPETFTSGMRPVCLFLCHESRHSLESLAVFGDAARTTRAAGARCRRA